MPDEPLDPAATDQLAAAMSGGTPAFPPPVDPSLAGLPPPELGDQGFVRPAWIPQHWYAPAMDATSEAPALPIAPIMGPAMAGAPPPDIGNPAPLALGPMPAPAPPPAAPPLPPPDAVTGAGGTPVRGELGGVPFSATPTPEQSYAATARGYLERPDALLNKIVGGQIDPDTQRYLDEFALRDPAGFGELNLRLADAKAKHLAAEQQRIQTEDFERQKANWEIRQRAIADAQRKGAEIDAEAQRILATKIDAGGNLSPFQRVTGVLMGVIGGLVQSRTGAARNAGLDAFNDIVNRNIEAQKFDLANRREALGQRRSALADSYARSNDLFQSQEAFRLALLKHADDVLATQQQNFAADGTRGMQIAAFRGGIAAQQAQALRDINQKAFDNSVKAQNAAREQQLADSTTWKNRQDVALGWAKEAREGAKTKADNAVLTPQQIRENFPDFPVSAIPSQGATVADLLKRSEVANKAQEIRNQSLETTNVIPGVTEKTPDGKEKPFIAVGKAEELAKVRAKVAASSTIVHLLDEAQRIRSGYSNNNLSNRKEWLQLKQIWGAAKAKGKDSLGLGALSSDDYKLLNEYLGTDDPTSFRDPTEGIKQSRLTVMQDLNDTLGSVGYRGRFEIADTSKPPPVTDTADDKLKKMVAGKPSDARPSPSARIDPDVHSAAPPTPRDIEIEREYPGMARPQRDALEMWAAQLQGDDPVARDRAAENLAEMAGLSNELPGATDAAVRAYARALLVQNIRPFPATSENTTTGTSELRTITGQSPGAEPAPAMAQPPDWKVR